MKIFGITIASVVGLIALVAVAFALNLGGLEWNRFFQPKYEDVKRQTFERNKSYVHGSIQDLGKRYREHTAADTEDDRAIIRNLVAIEFAEFDADLIKSRDLRDFLIRCRGY
jgi:hypothetical protein